MFNHKFGIYLNTIDKVKMFVAIVSKYGYIDVEVHQGRFIVDGKSIMGVFSLNLCNKVNVYLNAYNKVDLDALLVELRYYGFGI